MGIRDWFKKKEDGPQTKKIEGAWKFRDGNTHLTISDFTDTGVSYGDLVDGFTPMKLYTFKMYKKNLDTRTLGKMFEEVAFEAPAEWDIEACINDGMLSTLLNNTNAINKSYNDDGRQIEVLGRFDSNSNFTNSNPGIQDYIDTTYVPELNEQINRQINAEAKRKQKEEDPGFLIKAMGKVLDFFDGIKEKREARKQALLQAPQEEYAVSNEDVYSNYSRADKGLSSNEIKLAGRDAFRIGNTNDGNVLAIDILGEPQMLDDGSYLYTANKQLVGSFHRAAVLNSVPNCQFSLPVPPEQLDDFLMGCENPQNPYAKSNAEALMYLLNQKPIEGRGLYMGGLFVGNDRNLYYHEFPHMQASIDCLNGNDRTQTQQPQRTTDEYEKY